MTYQQFRDSDRVLLAGSKDGAFDNPQGIFAVAGIADKVTVRASDMAVRLGPAIGTGHCLGLVQIIQAGAADHAIFCLLCLCHDGNYTRAQ
jgi:hypothetical protein